MPNLFTLLLVAGTSSFNPMQVQAPAPATKAAETAREDPAVTALARKIYAQMRAGRVDSSLLTAQMNEALSPDVLAQTMPIFEQLGDPVKLELVGREVIGEGVRYVYLATFAAAQLHVKIVLMKDGKVGGYDLSL